MQEAASLRRAELHKINERKRKLIKTLQKQLKRCHGTQACLNKTKQVSVSFLSISLA
jgi:hypothetical protein